MRIGIVGTGKTVSIADFHTKALCRDSRAALNAVFNRNAETSRAWIRRHDIEAKICSNYRELLEASDAVIICTPNSSHYDYAFRAIQAGKHVLCEKPLAVNARQARDLANMAARSGLCCKVGFVYRFSPGVAALKDLVSRQIGRVYAIQARMGGCRLADPRVGMEWRMYHSLSGHGALGDFGSHLLDIVSYACGIRYDAIKCMRSVAISRRPLGEHTAQVETDDLAAFICSGAGSVGSFSVSRVGMDEPFLLVIGAGGMARLRLGAARELKYFVKDADGAYTGETREIPVADEDIFVQGFHRQIQDFLDAAEGKASIGADFTDGLYVEQLLEKAGNDACHNKNAND